MFAGYPGHCYPVYGRAWKSQILIKKDKHKHTKTNVFQIQMALFYLYRFVYNNFHLNCLWMIIFSYVEIQTTGHKEQGIPHGHILQKSKEKNITCAYITYAHIHTYTCYTCVFVSIKKWKMGTIASTETERQAHKDRKRGRERAQ